MKMVEMEKIGNLEAEVALPRVGTRCRVCGEPIVLNNFIRTSTPSLTSCFVHRACCRVRDYHEGFRTPSGEKMPLFNRGKATRKEEILFTPEVEYNNTYSFDMDDIENRAKFLACNPGYIENDCTVSGEYHPFTRLNLHGLKAWYKQLEGFFDMTGRNVGHHVNMTWYDCDNEQIAKIHRNASALFFPVECWMTDHKAETIEIFGRYFSTYCERDGEFVHGSWVNMVYGYYTADCNARIEYRLPHYVNAQQMTHCIMLLQTWTKSLRAYAKGEQDEKRTAKQILRAIEKHAEGKAVYQRPERNKETN